MVDVGAQLDRYLEPGAVDRLRHYFSDDHRYTGRRFERFADGGDREEIASVFTSDDVVAVSMLSTGVPGEAALELLEHQAAEINALLADIPNDVDLWDADKAAVDHESTAEQLWRRLCKIDHIGWVTAGKLLARKRPRLIPVYDEVVRDAIGVEVADDWWLVLREALRDGDRWSRLRELRDEAHIGDDISLLRVLDVAIWITKHEPLETG